MITTQASDDVLSELLIAQLLEEDLSLAALAQEAERIQLEQVLSESKVGNQGKDPAGKRELSSSPEASMRSMQTDSDIALRTMASEARLASDTAYAQELQRLQNAGLLADEQVARKWAAAEVKLMLDAEFARKLQEMDEEGEDTDDPKLLDVERSYYCYLNIMRLDRFCTAYRGEIPSRTSWYGKAL